jgi:hypothetical protein
MKRLVSVLSMLLLGVEILDNDFMHQGEVVTPNKS